MTEFIVYGESALNGPYVIAQLDFATGIYHEFARTALYRNALDLVESLNRVEVLES